MGVVSTSRRGVSEEARASLGCCFLKFHGLVLRRHKNLRHVMFPKKMVRYHLRIQSDEVMNHEDEKFSSASEACHLFFPVQYLLYSPLGAGASIQKSSISQGSVDLDESLISQEAGQTRRSEKFSGPSASKNPA